jgi:hypothetical protein
MTDEPDPADVARMAEAMRGMGDQDPDPVGDASVLAVVVGVAALFSVPALLAVIYIFAKLVMAWVMPL